MAGLFGFIFGESPKAQVYRNDNDVVVDNTTVNEYGASDLTGVAKYLQGQKTPASATGVAKYLKTKEQHSPSRVAKYLARQAIASKQKIESDVSEIISATGVEKYLKTHENRPKASGVAKYLANQSQHSASGVAKYMARRIIAARNAPPVIKTSGVALYLENRKEVLATGVSKYMAKQVLMAKTIVAETAAVVESTVTLEPVTGVEKYLQAKS
ncbi:MAG: hypothetical protein Q9M50_03290 [Methylococcales bacterium]|nr:hypothetical protein [Methylococcales bacterium]